MKSEIGKSIAADSLSVVAFITAHAAVLVGLWWTM